MAGRLHLHHEHVSSAFAEGLSVPNAGLLRAHSERSYTRFTVGSARWYHHPCNS
jgi:hypothetical protein